MRYRIEWNSWHGDKSAIIEAVSEDAALNVAEQLWHKDEQDRVCEINAHLIEPDTGEG